MQEKKCILWTFFFLFFTSNNFTVCGLHYYYKQMNKTTPHQPNKRDASLAPPPHMSCMQGFQGQLRQRSFSNFFQNISPYQRELWKDMHCQGGTSKPRGVLCTPPKGIKMQLVPKAEFQTLLIHPQLQIIQLALDNIKIQMVQMSSNCKSKGICANPFYSICFCTYRGISDQASTFSSALRITTWIWTMPEAAPRTHQNHSDLIFFPCLFQ